MAIIKTGIRSHIKKEENDRESVKANKMGQNSGKFVLTMFLILVTLAACAAAIYYRQYFERFQYLGYPGAFIFGFVAGSSLPMPLPYLIVTFSLGGVLNPAVVGLASGIGAGIGGTLVYLFGSGGTRLIPGINVSRFSPGTEESAQRFYTRLQRWTHRRGSLVVFLMSIAFNPFFAPMAVTIGALRFGVWRFLLWCTLGNIIKSMFIAYCGYFGLNAVLRWLGV